MEKPPTSFGMPQDIGSGHTVDDARWFPIGICTIEGYRRACSHTQRSTHPSILLKHQHVQLSRQNITTTFYNTRAFAIAQQRCRNLPDKQLHTHQHHKAATQATLYIYTLRCSSVQSKSADIEEKGVRLRRTVVDTPGFWRLCQ